MRRVGPVRGALSWTFRRVIGVYFRAIEVAGDAPAPTTEGRVFVANHVNALVDAILVLTRAPCPISPVAKSTLWQIPGLRFLLDAVSAVPIVRRRDDPTKAAGSNEEVFDKIAASLVGGQNILIFPEGTSHNEPSLLEVKTGAARMLARAKEAGGEGLTLQAVALEFDERHLFRSRVLMRYGPVRRVDDYGPPGEALVAALTARLRDDLADLLVAGATWPERLLIARVATMIANDTGDPSLERWNSVGREVASAREALRGGSDDEVRAIEGAVSRYHDGLTREGLDDAQLAAGEAPTRSFAHAAALVLVLPLAAVGVALFAIPYQLPRLVALRVAKEPDEISTYKLGVGLLVYPLWAAALGALAFAYFPAAIAAALVAVMLLCPFAALAWLDRTPQLVRSLRLRTRAQALSELTAARADVMGRIGEVRQRLGI